MLLNKNFFFFFLKCLQRNVHRVNQKTTKTEVKRKRKSRSNLFFITTRAEVYF